MNSYRKPLPEITPITKPFWEAAKDHVLKIQKCKRCGVAQFYPRASCINCGSRELDWIQVSGKGTVYAYTIVRTVIANSPEWQKDIPYAFAAVDLDEGARMYGRILGIEAGAVKVGMRVQVDFEDATEDIAIPYFKPLWG